MKKATFLTILFILTRSPLAIAFTECEALQNVLCASEYQNILLYRTYLEAGLNDENENSEESSELYQDTILDIHMHEREHNVVKLITAEACEGQEQNIECITPPND